MRWLAVVWVLVVAAGCASGDAAGGGTFYPHKDAVGDADAGPSCAEPCETSGRCFFVEISCADAPAFGDADAGAYFCGKGCEAQLKSDCEASADCVRFGWCSLGKAKDGSGRCLAKVDADCAGSTPCKEKQKCKVWDGACVDPNTAHSKCYSECWAHWQGIPCGATDGVCGPL